MPAPIVIATRESRLALWQAEHVRALLMRGGEVVVTLLPMTTRGDQILDRSLACGVRAASSSAIARSASRMLFLCTSVGWAVSTGEIQACSSVRAIWSAPMPRRASRSNAPWSEPRCRCPWRSCTARRRR